jgi:hypothetical protein
MGYRELRDPILVKGQPKRRDPDFWLSDTFERGLREDEIIVLENAAKR